MYCVNLRVINQLIKTKTKKIFQNIFTETEEHYMQGIIKNAHIELVSF